VSARRWERKLIVVTGAASGIGAATVHLFAREGARVLALDCNDCQCGEAAAPGVHYVRHDVSMQSDWQTLAQTISADGETVDALVNNAGIHLQSTIQPSICTNTFIESIS
jgi:NAD(P)-dependent dehydrogenase (short-subunit alcohol dehydrogenase family)